MSKKRNVGLSFVLALFLLTASVGAVSASKGASAQSLSATQESVVVGGDAACSFVEGLGVGLGIASLLGCAACAAPAAIIALVVLVAC